MPTTDWCIGSHPNVPACTFDVTVGATTEAQSISAGAYYLYRDGGALDLLDAFQDALNAHSLLSDATVFLAQDRLVQANSPTTSFSVTFTGDTTARNMMGFTGNLSSGMTHSANGLSAFLWSPGKPGSPESQLGTQGNTVYDSVIGSPGTGIVRSVRNNSFRKQGWKWKNIAAARVHTASESSGEFYQYWVNVLSRTRRFYIYRDVDEDTGSSTAADLSGDSFGPYQWIPPRSAMEFDAPRMFEYHHVRNRVEIKMHQVPEYT